jgi:hypothetical protein
VAPAADGGALVLALVQQLLLVNRPPRLLELRQASASSGPAALSLRFSRPMRALSVAGSSRLQPALPFTIQGEGNPLLLLPEAGQRIDGAGGACGWRGVDRRGLALRERLWHWDPRPLLVAVVPVPGGEQLQLRQPDGRWSPLSPVWAEIPELVPLGDGSGVGLVSRNGSGAHQVWRLSLDRDPLGRNVQDLDEVRGRRLERFDRRALLFAHLSTNRFGDLLVQSGGTRPESDRVVIWRRDGSRQQLDLDLGGSGLPAAPGGSGDRARTGRTVAALPATEATPAPDPARQPRPEQLLSRWPVAPCSLRHWPDFRRSLEIVEPGPGTPSRSGSARRPWWPAPAPGGESGSGHC